MQEGGAAFVGRRRELDFLTDAFARSREQRDPQLVTLVGVPGIGKSRLVYELSRVVDAEEELVFWRQGRSLPYGEGVTYWALAEMAKAHAGILESDRPEEAERKLAETVAGLQSERPERLLAGLRPLVGLGSDAEGGGERSERFAAWREFFESLAEQRPTVLVFEDLHWADDDLLDFVDHLVDWSTGVPLLVVCTARPELLERRAGWGGGKPNALTISIAPLSDDETARLLAALLERSVLPAEVQASLLARAGGNPLYAEQFARLLAEVGTHEELPLPENVQGIIAARLDGLPAAEKQLLQDAAVLGKVFWLGAACAVGGIDRDEGEARLHALERKEFVRRERRSSVGGEEEYAFRHLLVRDVAYGQIPRGARAARHERAAAWLEALGRPEDHAEMLVHHYLEAIALRRAAGDEPSAELADRARLAARDAGDRALALGAFPAAGRFFESALELWPADDEERPELLLAYARVTRRRRLARGRGPDRGDRGLPARREDRAGRRGRGTPGRCLAEQGRPRQVARAPRARPRAGRGSRPLAGQGLRLPGARARADDGGGARAVDRAGVGVAGAGRDAGPGGKQVAQPQHARRGAHPQR